MLIEYVMYQEAPRYEIVEHYAYSEKAQCEGVLIYDKKFKIYNLYIFDYFEVKRPLDAKFIVDNLEPYPLEMVDTIFQGKLQKPITFFQ